MIEISAATFKSRTLKCMKTDHVFQLGILYRATKFHMKEKEREQLTLTCSVEDTETKGMEWGW